MLLLFALNKEMVKFGDIGPVMGPYLHYMKVFVCSHYPLGIVPELEENAG